MSGDRVGHVIVAVGLTERLKRSSLSALGKDLVALATEVSERLRPE
jgi:hypothetical protein